MIRTLHGVMVAITVTAGFATAPVLELNAQKPRAFSAEEFQMVPVSIHLLRSSKCPPADCGLSSSDLERIFRKVNGIWHAAGIHFYPESVVSEDAVVQTGHEQDLSLSLDSLVALRPNATVALRAFNVYYVRAMAANGIYIGDDAVFIQSQAMLVKSPGGIDEPLPRVTAHELGHGLELRHRQNFTNLMASGTTGTTLNDAEIETARHHCMATKWILSPQALLQLAQADITAHHHGLALNRCQAVRDLPGDSALKNAARALLKQSSN